MSSAQRDQLSKELGSRPYKISLSDLTRQRRDRFFWLDKEWIIKEQEDVSATPKALSESSSLFTLAPKWDQRQQVPISTNSDSLSAVGGGTGASTIIHLAK